MLGALLMMGAAAGSGGSSTAFANLEHEWDFSDTSAYDGTNWAPTVGNVDMVRTGTINSTAGTQNGKNYIEKNLSTSSWMDAAIGTQSQPFGIQLVGDVSGSSETFFDSSSTTACAAWNASGVLRMAAGANLDENPCPTGFHVFYFDFNGASSRMYVDNTLVASGNAGTNVLTAGLRILNNRIQNVTATSSIGFVRFLGGTEDEADILTEQSALMTEWGIS